jgi:methyl-accepting chemotaxis protein/methyl-accepting chemotaxis protein-1 (serine sensor receptor)
VDEVAVAIHAITVETAKIKLAFEEINLGSAEQSRGIEQINRSITQMEQVTQGSAAGAEEGAAAAEELNAQAETMKDIVGRMKAMVDGAGSIALRVERSKPLGLAKAAPKRVAAVATFKSTVKFAPAVRKTAAVAAGNEFPMDDDFKAF